MFIPVSCPFTSKCMFSCHILQTSLYNFQNNATKDSCYSLFYCNKCPPIDSKINQNKRKEILLGKKRLNEILWEGHF